MNKISIIIPCYFNEKNIPITSKALIENEKLFDKDVEFEYVMVDDGSKDNTYVELLKFYEQYPNKVKIVKLAKNSGSFNAILAGFHYATGDCNIVLTADLQDPIEVLEKMYKYWTQGIMLVIANREGRCDPFFQRLFSNIYHNLIKRLAIANIPKGGFDLVLFDKQLKEKVIEIKEKNTNILYLLVWLGYDYINIPIVRKKREIGKSKWTLSKKIKMFVDSFVSFSFFPIRLISVMGLFLGLLAMIYAIFILILKLSGNIIIEGWTALMIVFLFISAFQMIALGIIGEYVWRNLDATRNRPNYIIEKIIEKKNR